ncbi:MAG: mechanosensitive ion channel [Sulfurimonadaceae bacterium]|nr:mechanosensitive ion channel [Sulfurimonadaceae bacterium]
MNFSGFLEQITIFANEYSFKIVAVVLIFVIGRFVAKQLTIFFKKVMIRARIDATLVVFMSNIIYFILLLIIFISALNAVDINTTSFIAVLGAATLGIGLALKDSLANIGAAVVIIIFRPFRVGDLVELSGATGIVQEINLFSTIIEPVDKSIVTIPNAHVLGRIIINYSKRKERRVEHIFRISYDDDLKYAKEILQRIIDEEPRILNEPESLVVVNALSENSVDLLFRAWTLVDDFWAVHYAILERVKLEFDAAGISIPKKQIDIRTK